MSRLTRARAQGDLTEARLGEALYLSAPKYRAKYARRRTRIEVNGRQMILEDVFAAGESRASVTYRTFWQRVRRLRKAGDLVSGSIEDALVYSAADWRSFYGGGRRRMHEYEGDLFPKLVGRKFRSIAAFLKTVGRYEDRSTVWSRMKSGWDLDSALIEPVVLESKRRGRIYKVTRKSNGHVYVGLTILSVQGRWAHHLAHSRGGGSGKLSRAISEDGSAGFRREVLEEGIEGAAALSAREGFWVSKLEALGPRGLNSARPGGLGLRRGIRIRVDGEEFQSKVEAASVVGQREGIPTHVAARRIREERPLAGKARKRSPHPDAGTNLFRRWLGLKKRHPGRVVKDWVTNYDSFKSAVEPTQIEGYELVRSDPSKHWGPKNFEWVSTREKIARTHGRSFRVGGRSYRTVKELAEAYGLGTSTVKDRLGKGMSATVAVRTPIGATSYRHSSGITVDGRTFRSKRQAILYLAETRGLTEGQARSRLETGKSE